MAGEGWQETNNADRSVHLTYLPTDRNTYIHTQRPCVHVAKLEAPYPRVRVSVCRPSIYALSVFRKSVPGRLARFRICHYNAGRYTRLGRQAGRKNQAHMT
mmetsp:Transcript_41785/g.118512  ORF Transcript_41785/g.118512 Transcript_41785/m.118512 type:complete len:101 (+) Transcript_41785:560-862(+)